MIKTTKFLPLILILLISCQNSDKTVSVKGKSTQKPPAQTCECEKTVATDFAFYATKIELRENNGAKSLNLKCATIEEGTASVADINGGGEFCRSHYDIGCVSDSEHLFKLADDFGYSSEGNRDAKLDTRMQFFQDLKTKKDDFFSIELNKDKAIKYIYRLKTK